MSSHSPTMRLIQIQSLTMLSLGMEKWALSYIFCGSEKLCIPYAERTSSILMKIRNAFTLGHNGLPCRILFYRYTFTNTKETNEQVQFLRHFSKNKNWKQYELRNIYNSYTKKYNLYNVDIKHFLSLLICHFSFCNFTNFMSALYIENWETWV